MKIKSLMVHHHKADPRADKSVPDTHQDTYSKTVLGFWMYLMTDLVIGNYHIHFSKTCRF